MGPPKPRRVTHPRGRGMWSAHQLGSFGHVRRARAPDIRCGIAFGPTVAVGGDVFGPATNLAARLTAVARRGTIVIPRAAMDQLAGRADIEIIRVRRSFELKGIGDMRVVAVRRRREVS